MKPRSPNCEDYTRTRHSRTRRIETSAAVDLSNQARTAEEILVQEVGGGGVGWQLK